MTAPVQARRCESDEAIGAPRNGPCGLTHVSTKFIRFQSGVTNYRNSISPFLNILNNVRRSTSNLPRLHVNMYIEPPKREETFGAHVPHIHTYIRV